MPNPTTVDPFTIEIIREQLIAAAEESFIAFVPNFADDMVDHFLN